MKEIEFINFIKENDLKLSKWNNSYYLTIPFFLLEKFINFIKKHKTKNWGKDVNIFEEGGFVCNLNVDSIEIEFDKLEEKFFNINLKNIFNRVRNK